MNHELNIYRKKMLCLQKNLFLDRLVAKQGTVLCAIKLQQNKEVSAFSLHQTLHMNGYNPFMRINTTNYKSNPMLTTDNTINDPNELFFHTFHQIICNVSSKNSAKTSLVICCFNADFMLTWCVYGPGLPKQYQLQRFLFNITVYLNGPNLTDFGQCLHL